MAQESPIQSWKSIWPSVVCAWKSGAVSPMRRLMVVLLLLPRWSARKPTRRDACYDGRETASMDWLDDAELRIGLGCMRLLDDDRGEEQAPATIEAALDAGVTIFDTARAYGDNERLLARALRGSR